MSKGSKRRKSSVSPKQYVSNWEQTFRKKEPKEIKLPMQIDAETQHKQATCDHEWLDLDDPAMVFEFSKVIAKCTKCETYRLADD